MQAQDWEQIRVFLAVMREKTLSRAAARLAVDVSTISRRLDRLETDLGAPLFDRTREGTTPTLLAEQMLPHAEEMELAAVRFSAAGAQTETEVEGVVRLTVPPGIADAFIAPALVALHARHPKLLVEIDASVGYADLTRREADLAIRAQRPSSGDLVSMKLATAQSRPIGSPSYVKELGRLDRLEDARWIVWGNDLAQLPDSQWLKKHHPNAVPVLRTSHFASQLAAARAGLGLVVTAQPPGPSGLVAVRIGKSLAGAWEELPVGQMWLVGHRALRHVPRVAAVWTFVVETMASIGDRAR